MIQIIFELLNLTKTIKYTQTVLNPPNLTLLWQPKTNWVPLGLCENKRKIKNNVLTPYGNKKNVEYLKERKNI